MANIHDIAAPTPGIEDHLRHPRGRRWLETPSMNLAKARLYCFPDPDRSAVTGVYESWRSWLAPEIDVLSVGPADHSISGRAPTAEELATALRPWLDLPFAFFGHDRGILLALEVGRFLKTVEWPTPLELFVAGGETSPFSAGALSTSDVHGTSAACLEHPVTIFRGSEDGSVDPTRLRTWRQLTESRCEICVIPGDRFFLQELGYLVAARVRHRILSTLNGIPSPMNRNLNRGKE